MLICLSPAPKNPNIKLAHAVPSMGQQHARRAQRRTTERARSHARRRAAHRALRVLRARGTRGRRTRLHRHLQRTARLPYRGELYTIQSLF